MAGDGAEAAGQDTELARLRERLAFYESFHQLIQDNVARSSDLLQEAAATRESAQQEIAAAQAAAAQAVAAAREAHRATLAALLTDLTRIQDDVADFGRRLGDALAAVEADLAGTVPDSGGGAAHAGAPGEATATSAPEAAESPEPAAPAAPATTPTAPSSSQETEAPPPVSPEQETTVEAVEPAAAEAGQSPRPITVLVHGVPRAATALSLQRHLAALDHVEGVEAREFAGGILRLHVLARRPLAIGDLGGWEAGEGLTPVNVFDDVLEVRLPGSTGL